MTNPPGSRSVVINFFGYILSFNSISPQSCQATADAFGWVLTASHFLTASKSGNADKNGGSVRVYKVWNILKYSNIGFLPINFIHSQSNMANGSAPLSSTQAHSASASDRYDKPIHHERHLKVICIGAGASGLLLAYKLQRSFENFSLVLYEKNDGISGTWYENRYPGCVVSTAVFAEPLINNFTL